MHLFFDMFLPRRYALSRESYAAKTRIIGISPEMAFPAIPDDIRKGDNPSL